ncbi:peptide chain release factor N(5)-glutamine methyltransferase [Candidatus Providencia siddallii]|uniref:Release factor glutamine methyltransferase n=1 Tax=Candidatus Providencia siddallii TaxID=1715285 RepID=A0ABP1CEA1_9GAMM
MKCIDWIKQATIRLSFSNTAIKDVEILLKYVTNYNYAYIFAFNEIKLTINEYKTLELFLQRREKGEPIAYIIGEYEFWSLSFYVSPVTLIPRSDTECLVEQALIRLSNKRYKILDLGTGTGIIALSIAFELPKCLIIGVDINYEIINLAKKNQFRLNIFNVCFLKSNWFSSLLYQRFDMIVSNPPYIKINDIHLKKGDLRFEPIIALVAYDNGMSNLAYIIKQSKKYLKKYGWVILEHGYKQGLSVRNLFKFYGYSNIKTCVDYSKCDRVSLAQYI